MTYTMSFIFCRFCLQVSHLHLRAGIKKGTDVLKALGLGAKMVFVGRPALWGLTGWSRWCR